MASIFEIDQEMMNLIDPETGELLDYDRYLELDMERNEKIERSILAYKTFCIQAKAIKNEIKVMQKRANTKIKNAEQIKERLSYFLNGKKFESPKCIAYFKKDTSVQIEDLDYFLSNAEEKYLNKKISITPDKAAIKAAIKEGKEVVGSKFIRKKEFNYTNARKKGK